MAGLVAAARARELGAEPLVLEKGDRAGGSMLLSSGVIWRHRTLDGFRAECPGGDPALQQVIVEQLDEAIAWLESLGAPVLEHETGNPRTIGKRFDTRGLTDALLRVIGDDSVRLSEPGLTPCTRAARSVHRRLPRAARARSRSAASAGTRGAKATASIVRSNAAARPPATLDEFYGRAHARRDPIDEAEFVPLSQLYGQFAEVVSEDGTQRFEGEVSWSETNLVQAIARWPGGRAWYRVAREPARGAGTRANGGGHDRAGARGRRDRAPGAAVHLGARRRRPSRRRSAASSSTRAAASSAPRTCSLPVRTPAGSRRAATRAGSPRRSSSAGSPPRKRSAGRREQVRARPRSCGSGD